MYSYGLLALSLRSDALLSIFVLKTSEWAFSIINLQTLNGALGLPVTRSLLQLHLHFLIISDAIRQREMFPI